MPSELQQNRYDQLIRRVGGIVGPGSKVSEVLTELFPVLDVENRPAELEVLGGTVLGFGGVQFAGAAGETPVAQLFNPIGSGMIVTVTRVDLEAETGTVRYGIEDNARGAVVANATPRDSRLGVDVRTTAEVRFGSLPALPLHTGRIIVVDGVNNVFFSEKGLFVLAPATGITFGSEVVTGLQSTSFMWRERIAEQSELNF